MLCRRHYSFLAVAYRPHLTRETNLPETDKAFATRPVPKTRHHRKQRRQVHGGLRNSKPPDDVDEHVFGTKLHVAMALQYGKQQRKPVLVDTLSEALRIAPVAISDQGLYFDQQRPAALPGDRYQAAGLSQCLSRQKNRGGIADFAETCRRHCEHAHFTRRAETVLDGPDHRIATRRVVLEVKDRIDHVFDSARTGDRTFLGYVPDDEYCNVLLLGELHESSDRFAQLRHGSRSRG